jgi:hypothetical protein
MTKPSCIYCGGVLGDEDEGEAHWGCAARPDLNRRVRAASDDDWVRRGDVLNVLYDEVDVLATGPLRRGDIEASIEPRVAAIQQCCRRVRDLQGMPRGDSAELGLLRGHCAFWEERSKTLHACLGEILQLCKVVLLKEGVSEP